MKKLSIFKTLFMALILLFSAAAFAGGKEKVANAPVPSFEETQPEKPKDDSNPSERSSGYWGG